MTTRAITRRPAETMAEGITTSHLGPPDYELALAQHAAYVDALRALSLEVVVLPPLPEYPDAHFVEDTAVVTPQLAVIANPGAEQRRGERDAIEPILARYRPTVRIEDPGTLDGGDVLQAGSTYFIGLSGRTNEEGARQLGAILEESGARWETIEVPTGLHLKSNASYLGRGTMLLDESLARAPQFRGFDVIVADRSERGAASTLHINGALFVAAGFPETRARLERAGFDPIELDMSEMQKMDGGLTCLSIRL